MYAKTQINFAILSEAKISVLSGAVSDTTAIHGHCEQIKDWVLCVGFLIAVRESCLLKVETGLGLERKDTPAGGCLHSSRLRRNQSNFCDAVTTATCRV